MTSFGTLPVELQEDIVRATLRYKRNTLFVFPRQSPHDRWWYQRSQFVSTFPLIYYRVGDPGFRNLLILSMLCKRLTGVYLPESVLARIRFCDVNKRTYAEALAEDAELDVEMLNVSGTICTCPSSVRSYFTLQSLGGVLAAIADRELRVYAAETKAHFEANASTADMCARRARWWEMEAIRLIPFTRAQLGTNGGTYRRVICDEDMINECKAFSASVGLPWEMEM